MINNTYTSSEQYLTSSLIFNLKNEEEVETAVLSFEESLRALNILHSIELRKRKIHDDLCIYYKFANPTEEIEFLNDNPKIINILPSLANYIKNNFDDNIILELELLSESKDWQTLFINAYTNIGWEQSTKLVDTFLENLYELYPEIAEQLNLNILPNEF